MCVLSSVVKFDQEDKKRNHECVKFTETKSLQTDGGQKDGQTDRGWTTCDLKSSLLT